MHRISLPFFLLVLATLGTARAESAFDGHWMGAIELPNSDLEFNIDLVSDESGALSGDISIPAQAIRDLGLIEVTTEGSRVGFKLADIPGEPTFDGQLSDDGTGISGTFSQSGGSVPFALTFSGARAVAARTALDGLDKLINQAIADFNVPGLGIAVVTGGEIVYARGFGLRDIENQLPMSADTLFAIGSTTKAMTATVLGMLADEGKLEWDSPLRTYLPDFTLSDPMISARITPRDLVTHRSGLPRHDLLWYNNNEGTRAQMIARFAHLELTADLREKFQYNNLMFMTAGYLAGQLSQSTWEKAMRDRLFQPLGMVRSNFSVVESQADPDHALPYREKDDELEQIPFRSIDLVGPAGSVNSSVNEMSQWLLFNLASGLAGDQQLINPATLEDIHSPQMTTRNSSTRPDIVSVGYGMGWGINIYRGHRRIAHGGGIDGFVTSVMLFPDADLGLVSFVNTGSGLGARINQHAADRVLGLEPVDWVGEALDERIKRREIRDEAEEKRDDMRVDKTRPSHPIDDYVGTFSHPGYGAITIARHKKKNGLIMTFNGIDAPLAHWHFDVWNGAENKDDPTFQDMKFLFRSNYDGEISAVEAPFERLGQPIVFEKTPDPRLFDAQYLQRFVATFVSQINQQEERVDLSGQALTLSIPGQPLYTLVPLVSGRFGIEGYQGYSVGFESDSEDRVSKIIYYQPNGVFESKRMD